MSNGKKFIIYIIILIAADYAFYGVHGDDGYKSWHQNTITCAYRSC